MLIHTESGVSIVTAEVMFLHYETNLSLPSVPSIYYSRSMLVIV